MISGFIKRFVAMPILLSNMFMLLAIVFYHPTDPSFNRAVDGEVHNITGSLGAFIADPIFQFFGYASLIPTLYMAYISVNVFWFNLKPRLVSFRLSFLLFATLLASFMLANISVEMPLGYGGFVGGFIKSEVALRINPIKTIMPAMLLTAMMLIFAFEVRLRGIIKFAVFSARMGVIGFSIIVWALRYLYFLAFKGAAKVAREEMDEHEYPDTESSGNNLIEIVSRPRLKETKSPVQSKFKLEPSDFELPSVTLLKEPDRSKKLVVNDYALSQNSKILQQVMDDFGIKGEILKIHPGPVVTLYEFDPAAGTKSSRVIGLADDIARSMSAISARIAVVPGKTALGIELPNAHREIVLLRELLESEAYFNSDAKLPLILGKNIAGEPVVADLTKMPHLLVAGTTGSGKSVAINTMILSLLYKYSPKECKLIMIDPKMLELSVYDGIPHLLAPVVTEPKKAISALKWAVKEMENRYKAMSMLGVRNIEGYNKAVLEAEKTGQKLEKQIQVGFDQATGKPKFETIAIDSTPLPFIVVIVDEMADLMLVAGKDIEGSIQRLAQMARAGGIHLIMATQRPSVDVITGVIKANFPTRISFQVTSKIDSRTILGEQGAEQLLGMGDMLHMKGGGRIERVHGPFVDDKEVEKITSFLKAQGSPSYIETITIDEGEEEGGYGEEFGGSGDEHYDQAVKIVLRDKKASTSYIQRCLRIGYNRAAIIIERMEKEGIVSPPNHVGKRDILLGNGE